MIIKGTPMVVSKNDFFFTLDKYSRLKMMPILFMIIVLKRMMVEWLRID